MQTIVYQCDTAMPAQKLPNCCKFIGLTFIGNVFIRSPVGVVCFGKRHPAGVFPNL